MLIQEVGAFPSTFLGGKTEGSMKNRILGRTKRWGAPTCFIIFSWFNHVQWFNQHILKTNPNVGRYNPSKNLGDFANPYVGCCSPKNEGLKENKLGFSFYSKISRIQWFNTLNVRCNNKRKGSTKIFFRRQPKLRKQLETIRCFPAKK